VIALKKPGLKKVNQLSTTNLMIEIVGFLSQIHKLAVHFKILKPVPMKKVILLILLITLCFACQNQPKESNKNELTLADSSATKTVLLQVNGMTCEGCEMTISKAVGSIDGVVNVEASFTDSLTTVIFDTSKANVVLISEKINELGYTVVGEIQRQ
jgi:copper chaperone CopZ